jgi:hypothetical protein
MLVKRCRLQFAMAICLVVYSLSSAFQLKLVFAIQDVKTQHCDCFLVRRIVLSDITYSITGRLHVPAWGIAIGVRSSCVHTFVVHKLRRCRNRLQEASEDQKKRSRDRRVACCSRNGLLFSLSLDSRELSNCSEAARVPCCWDFLPSLIKEKTNPFADMCDILSLCISAQNTNFS